MLSDVYGVRSQDMRWRTGGLEHPGRVEKIPLAMPPEFDVQPVGAGQRLSDMLVSGELDAVITARVPSCFGHSPMVTRLFPDYRAAERDYFRQTGLFPIMHVIVVRRKLVERHPWLATSLFKAFSQAKTASMNRLGEIGALAVALPWLVAEYEETVREMGADYWPYGVERNRGALSAAVRYAEEQGLTGRRVAVEELFVSCSELDGSAHV
jgi:4,5-dihydroxyphthalate decarboxylase